MVQLADLDMAGCKIINDRNKANVMVAHGVEYVVFRDWGLENLPELHYDRADRDRGKDFWLGNRVAFTTGLDRRVYIEPFNEKNTVRDGWFWLGLFEAAAGDGWKIGAFGDAVGHPDDFREFPEHSGQYVSETWHSRIDSGAMAFGKAHDFLNVYNGYSRMIPDGHGGAKETDDPACEIWPDGRRDNAAWFWFAGRSTSVYEKLPVPLDCRMLVFLGETGPSDAIYRGSQVLIHDINGLEGRFADDPYTVCYAYWTVGGDGGGPRPRGNYQFAYSTLDNSLDDLIAWRIAANAHAAGRR